MKKIYKIRYENVVLVRLVIVRIYYPLNHLGPTSVITNESGGVVEETFYDPYGAILGGGAINIK